MQERLEPWRIRDDENSANDTPEDSREGLCSMNFNSTPEFGNKYSQTWTG